jgi:heparan-alpha-glucosaminide N-acetyltransferase
MSQSAVSLQGETPAAGSGTRASASPSRLLSLDAYRGFVMLLMASDGLNISRIASQNPNSHFWEFLSYQTEHTELRGCSLWDLIQPSFTFMVGVALPFSLAKLRACGQGFWPMLGHAAWRALALTFLGVFLRIRLRGHTRLNMVEKNKCPVFASGGE